MQLYMSWYIRSFFGFTFLNILYFFKYSCTNISIDVVFILSIMNIVSIVGPYFLLPLDAKELQAQ